MKVNVNRRHKSIGRGISLRSGRLGRIFARYRDARKSMRVSISRQSQRGLDWMNFFLADVQTGFGAFVAFYLADLGWSKDQVGLALTAGTLAGVLCQAPGGALVDAIRWKRGLVAIGIGMICASALVFALVPSFLLVFSAEILHGLAGGIVTPAIAAISLGLVGRRAMSSRTGRNYRFDAFGNALTAGLMGLAGQYFVKSAIFLGSAALCIPALISLFLIRSDEIDYARARNAGSGKQAKSFQQNLRPGEEPDPVYLCRLRFFIPVGRCFHAASGWPEHSAEQERRGIVVDGGLDRYTSGPGRAPLAMGWILFRKVGSQAASACWLRARNCPRGPVCVLYRLCRAGGCPITWRRQRGSSDCPDGSSDH